MWMTLSILFGVMIPTVSIALIICLTVRGHYKRIEDGRTARLRAEKVAENERLHLLKQMWDEKVELQRQGLPSPQMDRAWDEAMKKFVK
jgi:hypothetical protein